MDSYYAWVQRCGEREFADELLVAAAAVELEIAITVIPYTPPGQPPWRLTTYNAGRNVIADVNGNNNRHLYLGNNDVHYVLLM